MTEHSALSLPCGKASRHSDLLWVLERFLAEHKRSDLVLLQKKCIATGSKNYSH